MKPTAAIKHYFRLTIIFMLILEKRKYMYIYVVITERKKYAIIFVYNVKNFEPVISFFFTTYSRKNILSSEHKIIINI